jgi:ATP-dependent Lhr-like helicase
MPLEAFHPLIQSWFAGRFAGPTEPQRLGWPAVFRGEDVLIAAPTGSGKTLAAFLAGMDRVWRLAEAGALCDQVYVLYVTPLRALSTDIERNLRVPLAELGELAVQQEMTPADIRIAVRTGDSAPAERRRMLTKPPHILVTTPESLYLLLTSERSREILRNVETVIVDEIHATARDKRGSHLALSLARLDALCEKRPARIGLSATQKPLDELARYLVGTNSPPPTVVDIGHARVMDLRVEIPTLELETICSHEHWADVYEQLVDVIGAHRSTLVFVNTRKLAERVAFQLAERLGAEHVLAHHGSMAHTTRRDVEERLKTGQLKAVVATASLELGIDVGHVEMVCQLGTPRSIATFLQRVGRAGHSISATPKGRLFALTRDELIECLALVRAVKEGRLDRVVLHEAPIDILAQQIVAAVACDEWDEDALYETFRGAYPYRDLAREDYDAVLEMLSEGISSSRGRRGAYLHRDRVNRRLRPRRNARLVAITCGGAIPEIANYRVVIDDDQKTFVGTLDEDFAIESNGGDVFLLGNTSWRIKHVRGGDVVVNDAHGAPPTIPFWRGEAPGRTGELSAEVADLRQAVADRLGELTDQNGVKRAIAWLETTCHVGTAGAHQAVIYIAAQIAAAGMIPTQRRVLFERFFDESGGMQLVVHAPFGTGVNRAWGLALRKRFCRTFNFELQASADDDGIVLSLGAQHSFPLEQMFSLVPSHVAREALTQAMLDVPFFKTRWRWNVTRALQMKRMENGRRVPPHLQRMRADDLLSSVFPESTACQEHVAGPIEIPDHILVRQTIDDCLHEAVDVDGFLQVLKTIEAGHVEMIGLDSREPSPFAHGRLNAQPYAFLDDAPLEERRARAVTMRRTLSPEAFRDLGALDPAAIEQVRRDAWPTVRDADELHDALLSLGALRAEECERWRDFADALRKTGRATFVTIADNATFLVATELCPLVGVVWPNARKHSAVAAPTGVRQDWTREDAVLHMVRGRIECSGPTTEQMLADLLAIRPEDAHLALLGLESQGAVLRGRFTSTDAETLEWCDRRLLARIHRLTLDGLRKQIAPVSARQYVRFLVAHQHAALAKRLRGQAALRLVVEQFQGVELPASHWERFFLPSRMENYDAAWLDAATFSGDVVWARLRPLFVSNGADSLAKAKAEFKRIKPLARRTPIALVLREDLPWLLPEASGEEPASFVRLGSNAKAAYEFLGKHGALFATELQTLLELMPSQVEEVLGELAAAGLITSDGFPALRSLFANRRETGRRGRRRRGMARGMVRGTRPNPVGGRWTLLRSRFFPSVESAERVDRWCRLLLARYGVVFRDLLAGEPLAPAWHDLVRNYRRLEARGEIRGGRFVEGVSGEQYGMSESLPLLRAAAEASDESITLPASDPLNLSGRLGETERIAAAPRAFVRIIGGKIEDADALPVAAGSRAMPRGVLAMLRRGEE